MALVDCPFFLFGMGNRKKYYYRNFTLFSIENGVEMTFDAQNEEIYPDKYQVIITLRDGSAVRLFENEEGFFAEQNGESVCLAAGHINLPDFEDYKHPELLRILHHEVLISVDGGKPYPNVFVYHKPWYRDGAMVALVLEKTGNTELIKDWVLSLDAFYDRNNGGHCEPDNLGQALYMLSLFADASHPMVPKIVEEARRIWQEGTGLYGIIDGAEHPVYSAKWLKFGLDALKLDSSWVKIPEVADGYSELFWMAYKDNHVAMPKKDYDDLYPYLWWASQHFYQMDVPQKHLQLKYPLTNETLASEAKYEDIRILCEEYADNNNASPHSWHAAEMFLYLIDKK